MSCPKVSVIIPCYNHGHFLQSALESVAKSTYPNLEVIVVNDGSTDPETINHLERLSGYQVKGNVIRIIHQKNQGLSATRNNGIQASTGELILALDADDKIDPTYIEKCVWVLTKNLEVSVVYSSIQHFGIQNDIWLSRPYDFEYLLIDNYLIAGSVYRRKVWEDVAGYDTNMKAYEDWDFWIRTGALGHKGYWLPEPLFYYRKAETSMLVEAHKRRQELISYIRSKNKDIYSQHKWINVPFFQKYKKVINVLSEKKSVLKWRVFKVIVRVSSKTPKAMKRPFVRLLQPVVRLTFGYAELGGGGSENAPESTHIRLDSGAPDFNIEYVSALSKSEINDDTAILFIVPWMEVGGADKVNLVLTKHLVQRRHSVHVFTTIKGEHKWHSEFKNYTPHITHLGNWFDDQTELESYVCDYIRAHNIRIIQISNSQLGYLLASKIKHNCQGVAIVDLLHSEAPTEPWDYFRFSINYKSNLERRIVLTEGQLKSMITKYGEIESRVTVIPNGVHVPSSYEETSYSDKAKNGTPTIAFVGRLSNEKQPITFVRMASVIRKHQPNVKFVVVGDGTLRSDCENLSKELGIRDAIEFLGNRSDVDTLLKETVHLLVSPSVYEGLPMVGLEAMSYGIPIVASDIPGWRTIISPGDNGVLVEVGKYEDFAKTCLTLLSQSSLLERMSQNAYHHVYSHYSIEDTVDKYERVYELALKQATPVLSTP